MNEREYDRLKREIEADYRKKIDALELIWELSGGQRKNGSVHQSSGIRGSLLKAIQTAVSETNGEFTVRKIEEMIKEKTPEIELKRPSISSSLQRLAEEGEIRVLESGSGKRPTVYARKDLAPPSAIATESQVAQIRAILDVGSFNIDEIKQRLVTEYHVGKLREMTSVQASHLLKSLTEELAKASQESHS